MWPSTIWKLWRAFNHQPCSLVRQTYECHRSKLRKFITFIHDHLVFNDRFAFLQSPIDKLVNLNKYKEVDCVNVLIDKR